VHHSGLPIEYVLIEIAEPVPQQEPAALGSGVPGKERQEGVKLLVRQFVETVVVSLDCRDRSRSISACGMRPLRRAVSVQVT
jgi:hypothetical protein